METARRAGGPGEGVVERRRARADRWPWLLLLAFGGMLAAALAGLLLVSEQPVPRPHPEHPGMLVSDEAPDGVLAWSLAWLFGAALLLGITLLLARGLVRPGAPRGRLALIALAGLLVQATFAGVLLAARPDAAPAPFWGPFPAPTTWMLLVFYPSQLAFVVLFAATWRRWGWTPDDEQRLAELLATATAGLAPPGGAPTMQPPPARAPAGSTSGVASPAPPGPPRPHDGKR